MADVSFSQAAAAYKSANKAGEYSKSVTGDGAIGAAVPGLNPIESPSFKELVGTGLEKAMATGYKSESLSARSIANEAELHELVTAVSNAELTLNTVIAVRDRVISAYQDIIKMPI